MADFDFLTACTNANAELLVLLPDNTVERIRRVSPDQIRERCPLLYFAFEDLLQSPRQASIEATSLGVVTCFLRFLYTGNYLKSDEEPQGCLLLLHAEICKIAEDFQVPELQVSAYVNFMESIEWACSVPSPPLGLCDAIQFIYKHLACDSSRQQQGLVDSLLNYCLSSFKYHKLGENLEFRQTVFANPTFHKQLCETSMARDFNDDGADDIIRLPVCKPQPQSINNCDMTDFFCDSEDKLEHTTKKQRIVSKEGATMTLRLKIPYRPAFSSGSESSSGEDDFVLVHRPKPTGSDILPITNAIEDPPSSPDLVSAPPSQKDFEVLRFLEDERSPLLQHAASMTSNISELTSETLLDLSSDEDWSMI